MSYNLLTTYPANAFASSGYSIYVPGRAVDGDTVTIGWASQPFPNVNPPQAWAYDFGLGNEKVVSKITLFNNSGASGINNFSLLAFNDNINYTDVVILCSGNLNGQVGSFDFTFSNTHTYRFYELYFPDWPTAFPQLTLDEIYFYELSSPPPLEEDLTETINIAESWTVDVTAIEKDLTENINVAELWDISTNPASRTADETIHIIENWVVALGGGINIFISTKLNAVFKSVSKFFTDLRTSVITSKAYSTHLNLKALVQDSYNTDLRVNNNPYDSIPIGSLHDFIVKKDGVELLDVDYNTLSITLALNTTPSRAEFTLARRHDDLDKMLDGTTSIITNKNKIQVYDNTTLLFTGYISEISADSTNDTVKVIAEDIRRQLSELSMELTVGGAWKQDSNHNGIPDDFPDPDTRAWNSPSYIRVEISVYQALNTLIADIGSLISGVDDYSFVGNFCPEWTKTENDYVSFLDQLLRQTANVNWYIDENERLRFQKIGLGDLKTLSLSSLNDKRHPYDLIVSDVQLNKMPTGYAKSLNVKRGFEISRIWNRQEFVGAINFEPTQFQQLSELSYIDFQAWNGVYQNKFYVGINQTIYGAAIQAGWILQPIVDVQWLSTNNIYSTQHYLPDITVGSGLPNKTIYLQSYGVKTVNAQWTEEIYQVGFLSDKIPYLVAKTEESYDWRDYLVDLAGFELSQSNKLLTSATASMLLDAYEYYNLNFSNLINFTNNIQSNIYKDNNGFPLNINSIKIDCSKRTVSLSLTNYGKSWYVKSVSYMKNFTAPTTVLLSKKQPIQKYIP